MSAYPYKAEQYLNEASTSLARMKSSKTFFEINEAFLSFLNASRFVFQAWKKDFKDLDGFNEWWKETAKTLENDELCKFFRDLRNRVTKEGLEPFWVNQVIRGPVTLHGPIQIGPQGILKGSIENNREKWSPIFVPGVNTTIGFKEVPKSFEKLNPFELCESYLEFLRRIVDEFVTTFRK